MEKMKRMKRIGDQGFSLVELIIVIAIMAILIGVLAPQYTRYVARSRVTKDTQAADVVRGALMSAFVDVEVLEADKPSLPVATTTVLSDPGTNTYWKLVHEFTGTGSALLLNGQLGSKDANHFRYTVDDYGAFTVYVCKSDGTPLITVK